MQKTIFVVDDNVTNLSMAKDALKNQYKVMAMTSAAKMFDMMERIQPDLILLDIEMPEMDGFEALRLLKDNKNYVAIPVIFLTSMNDSEIEAKGFQLGAIDFITKPFSAPVLNNRIKTHLDIDTIIRERTGQLQQKTTQLQILQDGIVHVLADMVENRDHTTGGHIERIIVYLRILIHELIAQNVYADELEGQDIDLLTSASCLHDVGKIAISDIILNKPGKLTDEEFDTMKTHTAQGAHVIEQIISRTGEADVLNNAKLFAGTHHERWDGKGYPAGLKATDIPLPGRLIAIVDVYDALRAERPYKKPFSHDDAVRIIMEGAGTQFDPLIADVFFKANKKFETV